MFIYIFINLFVNTENQISTSGNWNAGDSDWPDTGGA
jgi:hypothetical protein